MSLRHIYPWRVHPTHPFWAADDDDFDNFPFSSLTPRWRRPATWNPFTDFERMLAASEGGNERQAAKPKAQEKGDGAVIGHASDDKNFVYNFDLSGFDPKDIKLKTVGQKVVVEAESEINEHEEGCHSFCHRHYHRSLVLPKNIDPEAVSSSLSASGVLRISAPLLAIKGPEEQEREIPIQREKPEAVEDAPMADATSS